MLNPLNCNLYERTLTSAVGAYIEDLAPRLTSYSHTIAATVGFESCDMQLITTLEDARRYAGRLLCPLIVYGADADVAWEGYLAAVSYQVGDATISYGLDAVANRVRVRYTLRGLGTPQVTATATSSTSTAIYGTRDLVISAGPPTDSAGATALRDAVLAERALPRASAANSVRATGGGDGGGGGGVRLSLSFAGWYTTLDWVLTERTDTTTETTTTQVGSLLATSGVGIGVTNPFLSTSTAQIVSSGVSDTRQIAADTTYRAKIEALLSKGTSAGQRLAWGVYEGRVFRAATWAGATPTTITYRRSLASAQIATSAGAVVPPWRVRPDAMLETTTLLDPTPISGVIDTSGRSYVERVTCSIDAGGIALSLEPAASTAVDARIAQMGG